MSIHRTAVCIPLPCLLWIHCQRLHNSKVFAICQYHFWAICYCFKSDDVLRSKGSRITGKHNRLNAISYCKLVKGRKSCFRNRWPCHMSAFPVYQNEHFHSLQSCLLNYGRQKSGSPFPLWIRQEKNWGRIYPASVWSRTFPCAPAGVSGLPDASFPCHRSEHLRTAAGIPIDAESLTCILTGFFWGYPKKLSYLDKMEESLKITWQMVPVRLLYKRLAQANQY